MVREELFNKSMKKVVARVETLGIMESAHPSVDRPYGDIIFFYEDGTQKVIPKNNILVRKAIRSAILAESISSIKKPIKQQVPLMKESTKTDPLLVLGVGLLVIALLAGTVLIFM